MCIGPFAPKVQTPPPPPAPPAPIAIPQNIVSGTVDRSRLRRRAALSGGTGQNRTLLSGSLVSIPGSGSSTLG